MTEQEVLEQLERKAIQAATAGLLELYGAEVFAYVWSITKHEDQAEEAFAQACENVLSGLAEFRRESSLRTWFYAVARHAALREVRLSRRRHGERVSLLGEELAAAVRTATFDSRTTQVKDQIAELRNALAEGDRELLVLRVDRQLSFEDIALICSEADARSPSDLLTAAARHRKQFERAKDKLRELARAAGLLELKRAR